MTIRNLLIGCFIAMATLPAVASDYPEKLYLVGTMNNWTLPANGNLLEVPSISEGIYSITMDIEAGSNGSSISFKIFNTLSDNWMNGAEYYGAMPPDNNSTIFKDKPATWTLAPGFGSSDINISNVTSLTDAVITVNLKENLISVASESAPAAPQEIYIVNGSEKYPLKQIGDTSIFKGSLTLDPGNLELSFAGNNDFFLGSDGNTYYLWKDKPANYAMIMNSHNPFIVNNWMGGTLEVTFDITNSMVSFNSPDQPSFPESINMVIKGEDGKVTKFPMPSFETEYGYTFFTYTLENWDEDLQFTIEVPGIGTIYTDSEPIELWKDERAYLTLGSNYDKPITISNWAGGNLWLEINENFSYMYIASSTQPMNKRTLYLIGSPQGWKINEGTMELTQVDSYVFVGEFNMPADPMFRFYTSLGNWEIGSFGSQLEDSPVEVSLEPDKELNLPLTYGKGTWNFAGLPAGKMFMRVDLAEMKVIFSTSPIAGIDMTLDDEVRINIISGGIEINAPEGHETVVYDLTGKIVSKGNGSYRVSLPSGLYIANKEKIIVR